MAESIVKLAVEDSSFNAHIKRAAKEFADFGKSVASVGVDAFGKFAKGTETAKVAFQNFNKALKANAIVFVASLAVEVGQAIGEMIGNWISGANDAEEAQRQLNNELERTSLLMKEMSSYSKFNEQLMRARGASTTEIIEQRIKDAEKRLDEVSSRALKVTNNKNATLEQIQAAQKLVSDAEENLRQARRAWLINETAKQFHTGEYAQKGGGRVSSKSGKTITYASDSITAQSALVSELNKKWNDASEDMRTGYLFQLIEAEKKLKEMKGEQQAIRDMMTWGELKGVSPIGLADKLFPAKDLKKFKIELKLPNEKSGASLTKEVGNMASGISQMVGGVEALGIEIPDELKNVVNGISGVISILSGISTILVAIEAIAGADALIPFARGGIVRAAGGYVVPGNFGYDAVPALLTSGELVLNRAQQANLANQLSEGSPFRNMVLTATLSGEDLRLAINRNGKRTGRGEIVTTGFKMQ